MSDDYERDNVPVFPDDVKEKAEKPSVNDFETAEASFARAPQSSPESVSDPEPQEIPAQPVQDAPQTAAPDAAAAVEQPAEVYEDVFKSTESVENAQTPQEQPSPVQNAPTPPVIPFAPGGAPQQNGQYGYAPQGNPNPAYMPQGTPPYGYGAQSYPPQNGIYTQQRSYSYPPYQQQPSAPPTPPKKKSKGAKVFFGIFAAVLVITLVFCGVAFLGRDNSDDNSIPIAQGERNSNVIEDSTAANAPELETSTTPASSSGKNAVLTPVEIAAKVKPATVGIVVYANSSGTASNEGTGIIWKEDTAGEYTYIITCAHVISGANLDFTVQTEDGKQYDAERVGYDAKTDIGLLKIKETGLPLAEFGDSSALQVGDSVYAVGNPGGTEFFGSFTSGVVSAIDRSVKSTYTMVCIQHDAAINPGNSGGALVNSYGQVVGINSLKIVNTEYEGMGFAIPIKSAKSIIDALALNGYVPNRPQLGITYAEAIDYQQYSMIVKIKGLPSGSLIIMKIGSESDLVNSEAQQYDMIVAVNGEELTTADVLIDKIEESKVGDTLTLKLCRVDNNYSITEFDVKVKLVEDKGIEAETTTQAMFNPYDFFNDIY